MVAVFAYVKHVTPVGQRSCKRIDTREEFFDRDLPTALICKCRARGYATQQRQLVGDSSQPATVPLMRCIVGE